MTEMIEPVLTLPVAAQRLELGVARHARSGTAHGMRDSREQAGNGDCHGKLDAADVTVATKDGLAPEILFTTAGRHRLGEEIHLCEIWRQRTGGFIENGMNQGRADAGSCCQVHFHRHPRAAIFMSRGDDSRQMIRLRRKGPPKSCKRHDLHECQKVRRRNAEHAAQIGE